MTIKVGDVVQRLSQFQNTQGWPHGDKHMTVIGVTASHQLVFEDTFNNDWIPERFKLVQAFSPTPRTEDHKAAHRANDRDTAVAAATNLSDLSNKEARVFESIRMAGLAGMTGKQLAASTGLALNTVTPRFAPLQRKGYIQDSGQRRDRQIVWVAA